MSVHFVRGELLFEEETDVGIKRFYEEKNSQLLSFQIVDANLWFIKKMLFTFHVQRKRMFQTST